MKNILALSFALLSINSFSLGIRELTPQVWLISSEIDEKLNKNESQYIFEFNTLPNEEAGTKVLYSIDANDHTGILDKNLKLYIKTSPGAHSFQFYYNDQHFEIYADSLVILPQHTNIYEVRFESSEFPTLVEKPVIYLYPETKIDFSVKVKPMGELSFTYPAYIENWNGVALPNGDIIIDENIYNYLFWESNQLVNQNLIDTKKGTIVPREETLIFLETQLDNFGFNSKEKADFITFWAPQLQENKFNYVHFVLNDAANIFAELTVTPTPDHLYRFYMLSSKVENPNEFYYIEPQLIEPINRKGFTVIEWGGSKIDINTKKLNHIRL